MSEINLYHHEVRVAPLRSESYSDLHSWEYCPWTSALIMDSYPTAADTHQVMLK